MEETQVQDSAELVIAERKEKILSFVKKNSSALAYLVLAALAYFSFWIRTLNLDKLKDITTGAWTLGPDLDPWLFLRWAKYIAEHGSIMTIDMMRYVPIGYVTKGELLMTPYMIHWFNSLGEMFGFTESITHSAIIYPAAMFSLTVVAFFFMSRKIMSSELGNKWANVAALISSLFLILLPSLLPRTIAGIPEKESGAFFFLFASFYLFILSWKSDSKNIKYSTAILAGLATAAMAITWGGFMFLFLTVAPAVFVAFIIGKVGKKEFITYALWLATSFLFMNMFSTRYNLRDLFTSIDTGFGAGVLFILAFHFFVFPKISGKIPLWFKKNFPQTINSTIASVLVLVVLSTLLLGPMFLPNKVQSIMDNLITPSANRLLLTVAENRQPYFTEWASSYGPHLMGFPVTFWLFFVGAVYLFYNMVKPLNKKDRRYMVLAFTLFLVSLIFSRYSAGSVLNGTSFMSKFVYVIGFLIFLGAGIYYLRKYFVSGEESVLKKIDFRLILIFSFFFLSLVAARSSVRTIMVLDPSVAFILGYLIISSALRVSKIENKSWKIFGQIIVVAIVLLSIFSAYAFYTSMKYQSENYAPGAYNQQWQKAMAWVRENVPQEAVFGHWWDYGYWVQSIGERATVLDGGNAVSYWNHLMGRYALTGESNTEALEFLYAHNTTHFLIDSTDIGKYAAFSSIGSDVNYDRASFITTFYRNDQLMQEAKNSTLLAYTLPNGGISTDGNIVYNQNGSDILIPAGQGGIIAFTLERNANGEIVGQPAMVVIYNQNQYNIPIRYVYDGALLDFKNGLGATLFLYPRAIENAGNLQLDMTGAALYLSERVAKSQLARLYLYNELNENFKVVHSEDDILIEQIKAQNPSYSSDFIDYGGFRGPIKIWEITYPEGLEFKEEFLETKYPLELLSVGR